MGLLLAIRTGLGLSLTSNEADVGFRVQSSVAIERVDSVTDLDTSEKASIVLDEQVFRDWLLDVGSGVEGIGY